MDGAMDILSEIKAEPTNQPTQCLLAKWLPTLSKTDAKNLFVAIADPSIKATQIAKVVKRRGFPGADPDQTIRRHRERPCEGCGRTLKGLP